MILGQIKSIKSLQKYLIKYPLYKIVIYENQASKGKEGHIILKAPPKTNRKNEHCCYAIPYRRLNEFN